MVNELEPVVQVCELLFRRRVIGSRVVFDALVACASVENGLLATLLLRRNWRRTSSA